MDKKIRFDIIRTRNIWFLISLIVIGVGIASLVTRNLNYGVDFTGGQILRFKTGIEVNTGDVDRIIGEYGIEANPAQVLAGGHEFIVRVKSYATAAQIAALESAERKKQSTAYNAKIRDLKIGFNVELFDIDPENFTLFALPDKLDRELLNGTLEKNGFLPENVVITGTEELPRENEDDAQSFDVTLQFKDVGEDRIKELVTLLYKDKDIGGYRQFIKEDKIDPVFGVELKKKAMLALLLATIGILFYVTIRFEFWFAVAAIVALIHDCLITVGFYSILQLEVNSAFVAIILTVFGYSINDTIVIFDRIRENMRKNKKSPLDGIINDSLWETMPRSINTVLTTEVTILAILILGGASIKDFALGLSIGILSGCYSSILVAAPIAFIFKTYERFNGGASETAMPAGRSKKADARVTSTPRKQISKTSVAKSAAVTDKTDRKKHKKAKSKTGKKGKQRRR